MQMQLSRRLFGRFIPPNPLVAVAVVAVARLLPRPAPAPPGGGGDLGGELGITRTVTSPVSLAGPHATMTIRSADGHMWNLVLAPPPRSQQAGLKDGMIPVGANVTAHGHRHRDSDRFEVKTERLTWGDRVFNVYPDRS